MKDVNEENDSPLSAQQFCAALNGQDVKEAFKALRAFAKFHIHKDYEKAVDDLQKMIMMTSSNSSLLLQDGKKLKERWMEDTNEYNVPFVGTSIGNLGSTDANNDVIAEYLSISPSCSEFSRKNVEYWIDEIGKQNSPSFDLKSLGADYKILMQMAFYDAVRALFVHPKGKSNSYVRKIVFQEYLSYMVKDSIYNLSGKKSVKEATNEGTQVIKGVQGLLGSRKARRLSAMLAFKLMYNMVPCCKNNDYSFEILMEDEDKWKNAIKSTLSSPTRPKKKDDIEQEMVDDSLRVSCIEFGSQLIVYQQSKMVLYSLLYNSLRIGMSGDTSESWSDTYFDTFSDLLRHLRKILFDTKIFQELLSNRALNELFNGEPLDKLAKFTCRAPLLIQSNNTSDDVLHGTDSYDELSDNSNGSCKFYIECRRFLYSLLSSKSSPVLGLSHRNYKTEQTHWLSLSRILLSSISFADIQARYFVLKCVKAYKAYLPGIFASLSLSDVVKDTLDTVTDYCFVRYLIQNSPPLTSYCKGDITLVHADDGIDSPSSMNAFVDRLLLCTLPISLSKSILVKAILHQNHFIALEALKLILHILRRIQDLESIDSINWVRDGLEKRLPDIQAILSVRSNYDYFGENGCSKTNLLITDLVLQILEMYGSFLPQSFADLKFDWMKMFPSNADIFLSSSKLLQVKLLQVGKKLLFTKKGSPRIRIGGKHLYLFLSICVHSKSDQIYYYARDLCRSIISRSLVSANSSDETRISYDYEASLWIDAIDNQSLEEFIKAFDDAIKNGIHHIINFAQLMTSKYTNDHGRLESACFSPLLIASYNLMNQVQGTSDAFNKLCFFVSSRLLLFHRDPRPLAILLSSFDSLNHSMHMDIKELANAVLSVTNETMNMQYNHIQSCLCKYFTSNSSAPNLFHLMVKFLVSDVDDLVAIFKHQIRYLKCVQSINAIVRYALFLIQILYLDRKHSGSSGLQQKIDVFNNFIELILIRIFTKDFCTDDRFLVIDSIFGQFVSQSQLSQRELVFLRIISNFMSTEVENNFYLVNCISKYSDHLKLLLESKEPIKLVSLNDFASVSYGIALSPSLPAQFSNAWKKSLIQTLRGTLKSGDHCKWVVTLTSKVLQSQFGEDSFTMDDSIIEQIIEVTNLWFDLAQYGFEKVDEISSIWLYADSYLASLLHIDRFVGIISAIITARMNSYQNLDTVKASIMSLSLRFIISDQYSLCKNCALINCFHYVDQSKFRYCLLKLLTDRHKTTIEVLQKGALDETVKLLFLSSDFKNDYLMAYPELSQSLNIIAERAINQSNLGNSILLPVLKKLLFIKAASLSLRKHVCCHLITLLKNGIEKSKRKTKQSTNEKDLINTFLSSNAETSLEIDNEMSGDINRLRCMTFCYLCSLIPKLLKKGKYSHQYTKKIGENEIRSAIIILRSNYDFEKGDLLDYVEIILGAIVACLKTGINAEGGVLSVLCLEFVREVVVRTEKSTMMKPSLCILSSELNTQQIFDMTVSHSKFQATICSKPSLDSEKNQIQINCHPALELARLILGYISLGDGQLNISNDTIIVLLTAYNAGTTPFDRCLRRILFLIEQAKQNEQLIFIDTFCWGEAATKLRIESENICENRYKWFLSVLDIKRVRQTLTQIPFQDEFFPQPEQDIEVWNNQEEAFKKEESPDSTDDDEESDSDLSTCGNDSIRGQEKVGSKRKPPSTNAFETLASMTRIEWVGVGEDQRYSLAAILPLILSTLKAYLPINGLRSTEDEDIDVEMDTKGLDVNEYDIDNVKDIQHSDFVRVAKILIDRGAISLCFSAMGCRCQTLRQIAVSSLGLFLQAVRTKEAKSDTRWNPRTQIDMMLNSFQLGLALRRQKYINQQGDIDYGTHKIIPAIPPVVALFLARASLVLMKSADPLFPSMNAYFLRISDNYGAFKDFYGLPSFISLYCSSDPGHELNQSERIWALHLLIDGIVDRHSFRIVSRRHILSLLLSSFQILTPYCREACEDTERKLIIETIQSTIKKCGPFAAIFLVKNVGIIAWLKGIVSTQQLDIVLPTISLRYTLLETVNTLLSSLTLINLENENIFVDDIVNLSGQILNLATKTIRELTSKSASVVRHGARIKLKEFIELVHNLYRTIGRIELSRSSMVIENLQFSNHGIELEDFGDLLSYLKSIEQCCDDGFLFSLAILPIHYPSDLEVANKFFIRVFTSALTKENDNLVTLAVAKCISLCEKLPFDRELLKQMLANRNIMMSLEGGIDSWKKSINIFTSNIETTDDRDYSLASIANQL